MLNVNSLKEGKEKKMRKIRNVERNKGNKKVQEDGWVKKKRKKASVGRVWASQLMTASR